MWWTAERCRKFLNESCTFIQSESDARIAAFGAVQTIVNNEHSSPETKVQEVKNVIMAFQELKEKLSATDHGPKPAA